MSNNENLLIMEEAWLGGLNDGAPEVDVGKELDYKSASACIQHIGMLFVENLLDKGIGKIVYNDVAWTIDIDIREERVIGTSNVLFLKNVFELVMDDDDLIHKLLGDCEVGVNILQKIYDYQEDPLDEYVCPRYQGLHYDDDGAHQLLKYVTNALVTLGKLNTLGMTRGKAPAVVSFRPKQKTIAAPQTLSFHLPSQQGDGSKALSALMFTDPEIVDYRQVLEGFRGEDSANEIYCQTWDCLEGINLGWAIRNKSIFLPRLKSLRVMFCDALMRRFPFANCGQLSNGRGMGAQMAFATKACINYQGSIPSDKMDKGNKSVDYLMRVLIYEAFRDGGTSSEEWTKDAALKVVEDYIAFFDWSLLCCEGDEKDVNGTSWETMKEQLEKHGGLMLWRGFAVINSAFYAIEYHIASDGKQFQLLEASSRTMKLSHGRTTDDDVLSNKLIQIFPLCHANALEMWISNRKVFSYLRLLKLDQNLSSYLQPLVGTTIPDGNDTLVLNKESFHLFIKRAKLHGLSQKQVEEVYEADRKLRIEKKSVKLSLQRHFITDKIAFEAGKNSIESVLGEIMNKLAVV